MSEIILLIVDNRYCQVNGDDEIITKLRKVFSFQQPGAEYSPAFRNGYWNGIIQLIDKCNRFSLGLIERIEKFLNKEKITYNIIDKRKPVEKNTSLQIIEKLEVMDKIPRSYQINTAEELIRNERGIAKLATGAGKSIIIGLVAAMINKQSLILVVSLDLLEQFHKLFTQMFNEPIGRIGDGEINIKRINIATLWTVARSLGMKNKDILEDDDAIKEKFNVNHSLQIKKMLVDTKVIIFDECHLASCSSLQKIYKETNAEHFYGFSATPKKDGDDAVLVNSIFGEVKINIPAAELIEKNYLVKPIIKLVNVPAMYLTSDVYAGIYKEYIVENEIRNSMIVGAAEKLIANGYKTLMLFRVINHGKTLYEMCRERGLRCALLSGTDNLERREEVKNQIANGEIDLIISSTIFEVGVDIPCLNGLILGSGGKSSIKTLQRIGRVLRPFDNKTHCKVVDFIDNAKYLKSHSKKRIKIYKNEPGFELHLPTNYK